MMAETVWKEHTYGEVHPLWKTLEKREAPAWRYAAGHLGRAEPRNTQKSKPQSLQQEKDTEMELLLIQRAENFQEDLKMIGL